MSEILLYCVLIMGEKQCYETEVNEVETEIVHDILGEE